VVREKLRAAFGLQRFQILIPSADGASVLLNDNEWRRLIAFDGKCIRLQIAKHAQSDDQDRPVAPTSSQPTKEPDSRSSASDLISHSGSQVQTASGCSIDVHFGAEIALPSALPNVHVVTSAEDHGSTSDETERLRWDTCVQLVGEQLALSFDAALARWQQTEDVRQSLEAKGWSHKEAELAALKACLEFDDDAARHFRSWCLEIMCTTDDEAGQRDARSTRRTARDQLKGRWMPFLDPEMRVLASLDELCRVTNETPVDVVEHLHKVSLITRQHFSLHCSPALDDPELFREGPTAFVSLAHCANMDFATWAVCLASGPEGWMKIAGDGYETGSRVAEGCMCRRWRRRERDCRAWPSSSVGDPVHEAAAVCPAYGSSPIRLVLIRLGLGTSKAITRSMDVR
jgi:hypothetical protein